MATWIGHLRIAENLLGLIDGLDAEVLFWAADRIAESNQTVRDLGVPEEELRSAVVRLEQKRLLMTGGGGSRFLALPLQV